LRGRSPFGCPLLCSCIGRLSSLIGDLELGFRLARVERGAVRLAAELEPILGALFLKNGKLHLPPRRSVSLDYVAVRGSAGA
jgi:hypothetical protein